MHARPQRINTSIATCVRRANVQVQRSSGCMLWCCSECIIHWQWCHERGNAVRPRYLSQNDIDELNSKFYGVAYIMTSGRDSHMWDGRTCCTYFEQVLTTSLDNRADGVAHLFCQLPVHINMFLACVLLHVILYIIGNVPEHDGNNPLISSYRRAPSKSNTLWFTSPIHMESKNESMP